MTIISFLKTHQKNILRKLVTVIVCTACLAGIFILINPSICRFAINKFQEQTGLTIDAQNVRLNFDGSVHMRSVKISTPEDAEFKKEILKSEKLYLRFEIFSLFSLKPKIKNVTLKNFTVVLLQDCDAGQWNFSSVHFPISKTSSKFFPNIILQNGTLVYLKTVNSNLQTVFSMMFNAKFYHTNSSSSSYKFYITTSDDGINFTRKIAGSLNDGNIDLSGDLSTLNLNVCKNYLDVNGVSASLKYDSDNRFDFSADIKNGVFKDRSEINSFVVPKNPNTFDSPALNAISRILFRYNLSGLGSLSFRASGDFDEPKKIDFNGVLNFKNSSVSYYKFIYPLHDVSGRISFTNKGTVYEDVKGSHNGVDIALSGWSRGYGDTWQSSIDILSSNMKLDNDLYFAITPKEKKLWNSFSPSGLISFKFNMTADINTDDIVTIDADLNNVRAKYSYFPYPLKNLNGKILFTHDSAVLKDVTSNVAPGKIIINGKASAIDPNKPNYSIKIDTEKLPFDSNFAYALKNSTFPLFKVMDINNGNFEGAVSMTSHFWSGSGKDSFCYNVSADVNNLLLNKGVISLLPDNAEKFISAIDIAGYVNLDLHLLREKDVNVPKYEIALACLNNKADLTRFGYRFKDITGSALITNNSLKFDNISAFTQEDITFITPQAAFPHIRLNGTLNVPEGIFSDANFCVLAQDFPFDKRVCRLFKQDSTAAKICDYLSPQGSFDIDFRKLMINAVDHNSNNVQVDANVILHSVSFQTSPPINDVNSKFSIFYQFNTSDSNQKMAVRMDANTIRINNKLLKNVQADISYDPNNFEYKTTNLDAELYKGRFSSKLQFRKTPENFYEYTIDSFFENVDLKEFLSDKAVKAKESSDSNGIMSGTLAINGRVGEASTRTGIVRLNIQQMQVGRLSPLGKLLSVLQLTEPKDYAFDKMVVDSYIKGENLIVDKFDLSGQDLAFNGSGTLNFEKKNIDMKLTARGQHLALSRDSFLQPVADVFSRAVIRIDVSGDPYNPDVSVVPLPIIKDTLNLLGTKPDKNKGKK